MVSAAFFGPVGDSNVTNGTHVNVCGSQSWRSSQNAMTTFGIVVATVSSLVYVLSIAITMAGRHDVVKKTLSVSAMVSGVFFETLSLPLVLLQIMTLPHEKTTRLCLSVQVLQLMTMFAYLSGVALFFVVPLLVLRNPLRQSFFQSFRGRAIMVGGSWTLSILIPGAPGLAVILTSDNGLVPCCGWHLFPKSYSFTLIYGCLSPLAFSGIYASARFVYVARKKARETAAPIPAGPEAERSAIAASRHKRNLQCRWLSVLLFHSVVWIIPTGSVFLIYLHCPFCVHPELMWYIVNILLTFLTLMIAITNFSFKENRDAFKRLFLRCRWRGGRVAGF